MDIVEIVNKKTKCPVNVETITLKKVVPNSSNTKQLIWRFFQDGEIIKRNNDLLVTYKCPSCFRHNIVCMNNVIRKLNRGITKCNTCKNQEVSKVEAHSAFMMQHASSLRSHEYMKEPVLKPKWTLQEKLQRDKKLFDEQDDDFKHTYFRKHLTTEEFQRLKSKIVSFQNDKFNTIQDFEYCPCVSIPNQTKFAPYVYDIQRDVLEKITYIKYECENCGDHFTNRDLYIQKNKYKVLCQECSFCNNTFKVRKTQNINNEAVLYQSRFEMKFVEFCNAHGILICNGPAIMYTYKGKQHKYKVDFVVKGHLVEIKDNHHWHLKQVSSGKWQEKEKAAYDYATKHGMLYKIVYPRNYMEFCKYLLRLDKI